MERKDFGWSSSLNVGDNGNKMVKLEGDLKEVRRGRCIDKVGLGYCRYYMIEFGGMEGGEGEGGEVGGKWYDEGFYDEFLGLCFEVLGLWGLLGDWGLKVVGGGVGEDEGVEEGGEREGFGLVGKRSVVEGEGEGG